MPFVPIANTAKIELVGHNTLTLQPAVNVMHSSMAGADTLTIVTNIANAVKTTAAANLGVWSSSMQLDFVRVTSLVTATSPQFTAPFASSTFGTAAADCIPGACALVKLLSGTRGRSYRGRIYIGLIAANEVGDGDGTLSTSFQGVVNTYVSAIKTALNGLSPGVDPTIASRKLGTSAPWASATCEATVAYQRRRALR